MNREERRRAVRVRDVTRTAAAVRRGNGASHNPIAIAIGAATRLTGAEVREIVAPARDAIEAFRRGVATLAEWQQLASAINVSKAIERQGIVRGLHGHLSAAEETLSTIHRRASEELQSNPDARYPYALHLAEIDVLALAIELLFDYQLRKLSAGELRAAVAYAVNEIRSTGGQVIDRRPQPVQGALPLTEG